MKKKFIYCIFMVIFLQYGLYAESSVTFSKLKSLLNSNSYNQKKKLAGFQIFLKSKKVFKKEQFSFFLDFLLKPELCSSREIMGEISLFLSNNSAFTKDFKQRLKKTVAKNLSQPEYVVWALESYLNFLTAITFESETGKMEEIGSSTIDLGKCVEESKEFVIDITKKNDYKIFITAINQKSDLVQLITPFIFMNGDSIDRNKVELFFKAALAEIKQIKKHKLLSYIDSFAEEWGYYPPENSVTLFMDIADDSSLPGDLRNAASSLSSKIFYIEPSENWNWQKWYSENKKLYNRQEAAKKALLNSKYKDNIRIAALDYLTDCFESSKFEEFAAHEFLDDCVKAVNSTKSMAFVDATTSYLGFYSRKFPKNLKLKKAYTTIIKKPKPKGSAK